MRIQFEANRQFWRKQKRKNWNLVPNVEKYISKSNGNNTNISQTKKMLIFTVLSVQQTSSREAVQSLVRLWLDWPPVIGIDWQFAWFDQFNLDWDSVSHLFVVTVTVITGLVFRWWKHFLSHSLGTRRFFAMAMRTFRCFWHWCSNWHRFVCCGQRWWCRITMAIHHILHGME